MADAQRTIDLVFNGVDRTGAATAAALQNTQKFAGSIQTATQPIADFTASAVKLEAGLLGAGAAITAFAVSSATEFQSSLADLQKVLSDTESIEQYRDLALELSDVYGVSATQVVQSIADYKQAGFTAQEAGQLTRTGLDAVIAGSVDAAIASDRLVASLKGFGAEAGLSVDIVDLLNQVSNEYATNFGELLIGFSEFSPIARAAGLSLQETVGILTPGIEVFRSGSEVATSLRTAFGNLVSSTTPVAEALNTLKVNQKDANGELRSGRDIYFDVAEALQTVDQNQRIYLAQQLVGKNQSARFLAVVDGLDKSLRIAGDGFKFAGSAAKEVEVQLATAEKAADRAKVAFKNLFINFGTPLLDESTGIANAITKIFQAIGASALTDSGIGEIVQFVERELGSLQGTLEAIAENLPAALNQADLSGFADGVSAVSGAIRDLFRNADLTSAEGISEVITAIGNGFRLLSEFSAGAIDSLGPAAAALGDLAGSLRDADPERLAEIARGFGQFGGAASQVNALAGGLTGLVPVLEAFLAVATVRGGIGAIGAAAALGGGLAGFGTAAAAIGTLATAITGVNAAINAYQGDSADNWINSIPNIWGGSDVSTKIVDQFFAVKEGIGALNEAFKDGAAEERAARLGGALLELGSNAAEASKQDFVPASLERLETLSGSIVGKYSDIARSIAGLNDAADSGPLDNYVESIRVVNQESDSSRLKSYFQEYANGKRVFDDIGEVVSRNTGTLVDYNTGLEMVVKSNKDVAASGRDSAGTFSVISTEANKAAQSVLDLSNAGAELQIEFAIARLESQTAISTAKIEADAQKTVAAFESISKSVENSTTSVNDLFGLLGEEGISKFDKLGIKKQIETEQKRLKEKSDLEDRLIKEQIKNLRERREALKQGQGLITINGDGLAPHLEAFMYSILEAIQVRVNQDGYEMLLGAG